MSSVASSAREQFDRQASQYNERWASWSDETLRRMLGMAHPQAHWRVLDVATGTGFTALAFAPHVREVVGADISSGMLTQAKKRADEAGVTNVEWREARAESLPFADGSFELVTVRIAPHHFTDVPAFLRETRRVLKPGGVFLLGNTTVPDGYAEASEWQNRVERERDPSHGANLSPDTWQMLSEEAGFTVTDCDTRADGVPLALSAWLETAGCTGERAERVRALFADAPADARHLFSIETDEGGETRFWWHRVILRAERPS